MSKSIFQLELTRKIRTFAPIRLVPIILVLLYCLLMFYLYNSKGEFRIVDFGIKRVALIFGLFDIFLKYAFQKRQLTFPPYISLQPVPISTKILFELNSSIFDFWNYYWLFLFVPIFMLLDNVVFLIGEALLCFLISLSNCFVIRFFEKTSKIIYKIAVLFLPCYYALFFFFLKDFNVSVWCIVGAQIIILLVSIYISLKIKYYGERVSSLKFQLCDTHYLSVYGIDVLPILRSKRVVIPLLFFIPYMIFMLYNAAVPNDSVFRILLLLFAMASIGIYAQFNYAIEANYWNLCEVSPCMISSMFNRKFKFFFFFELIIMLVCLPLIFYRQVSVLYIVSITLVSAVFYNLTQLLNFLLVNKFDMWSTPFFNSQGVRTFSGICQLIPVVIIMGIAAICEYYDIIIVECVVFIILASVGFFMRHKAFALFYTIYRRNRYNIMERFTKN